jgi:ABC-type nitrate/sulfonate/bicarbonate transport system substrate-binding protein
MKKSALAILFIGLALGIVWFSGRLFFGTSSPASPESLTPVSVRLKWVNQSQFAGMYVAKNKGFYEQAGLDVTLLPFSFDVSPIEDVAAKKVDFGVTGAIEILKACSAGSPVKAFATIYQISPYAIYSLKGSGITKPADLLGRTLGLQPTTDSEMLYDVMMKSMGLDRAEVNEVEIGYDATELIEGKVDASMGYLINEPHQAIEKGFQVNTILLAEYGSDINGDVLIVHQDTLRTKPDLVVSFLRATLEGWRYAIANPEEATQITLEYAKDRTYSHEFYMLTRSIPLISTNEWPVGWMQEADWLATKNTLVDHGLFDPGLTVDGCINMDALNEIAQ